MWNKMKKIYCIICGLGLLFFSCREEEADFYADPAQRIYLRATVENAIPMSRAPFSPLAPDENNPLKVAVWASTEPNVFKNLNKNGSSDNNYEVALHTKAYFSNGKEQLLYDAVYPKPKSETEQGGEVCFVGLHPGIGWTTDDAGTIARKTFNGSEDVMFAPQEKGRYGQNTTERLWPTFKFKHLLTWLKVNVKSDGEEISDAWGRLQSLKLKSSAGNTVTIDLSKEYSPVYNPDSQENCVTFSSGDGVTLDFYKTGTDDVFLDETDPTTWYPIPYNSLKEVAYVLCAPVIASEKNVDGEQSYEYTLIVKTERRTVEVPVDLKANESTCFNGSTMKYQFTLNLNFKMGNSIVLTSRVTDWNIGGISNGILTP